MSSLAADDEDGINRLKLANLRTSLSHLTKHLHSVTNKLTRSQQQLSQLHRAHAKECELLEEERDGARALAAVWEARWRDERNQREEMQAKLGSSFAGQQINDRHVRAATQLVPLQRMARHRAFSASSASSSSETDDDVQHNSLSQIYSDATSDYTVSTAVAPRQRPPRMRTRQLIADLSRELERVRTEANRMLADRDEEIARLESDQAHRREESATFYAAVDKLLGLGIPIPAQHQDTHNTDNRSFANHARTSSVLDRADFQLAASQSRTPRAAVLEAEVRQLELELEQMANLGVRPPGVSERGGLLEGESAAASERAALADTISQLNLEVTDLRRDLTEVTTERAALRSLYEQTRQAADRALSSESDNEKVNRHPALVVAQLEADRARLAGLLRASEHESRSLSQQLSTNQSQVEHISERVRIKLLEQKTKLADAHARIAQLERELAQAERALEDARRREADLARKAEVGGRRSE